MALYKPLQDVTLYDLADRLSADLVEVYSGIEERLTAEIANRVRDGKNVSPSRAEQLATITRLRKIADAELNGINPYRLADQIIATAAEEGSRVAVQRLGLAKYLPRPEGMVGMGPGTVDALNMIALDLTNGLTQMHSRILRAVADDYQQIVASQVPDIIAGVQTLQRSQRLTVDAFLKRGLTGFIDKKGKRWRIGTYAEMAGRTATQRAWREGGIGRMRNVGLNLITPIIGRGACEKCSAWAGKVLSTDGTPAGTVQMQHASRDQMVTVTIHATLEEALAAGLHHPNCGCVDVAYMPGLPPTAGQTSFDAKANTDRAKLRELERRKRNLKRRMLGSDEVTARRLKNELRQADADIRKHVDEAGLNRQRHREQLGWADGKGGPTFRTPTAPPPIPDPLPTPDLGPETRRKVADAKNLLEVEQALNAGYSHRGVRFAGVNTKGIDLPRAKAWGDRLTKLIDAYPRVEVKLLTITPIKNSRVYAQATAKYGMTNGVRDRTKLVDLTMEMSSAKMKTTSKINTLFDADVAAGFHHKIPAGVAPVESIVTHEWGHLIDYTLQNNGIHLRAEIAAIRKRLLNAAGITNLNGKEQYEWTLKNISGYGRSNQQELIAEAFADAFENGQNATEFSRELTARVTELLEGLPDVVA